MVKQNNKNGGIDRLTRTLGAPGEDDKYYVYALFAKNAPLPFYIGKGCGGRVFDHKKAAEYVRDQIKVNYKGKEQERAFEQLKSNKIKKLLEGDLEHVIIKWGLSEQEAFFAESALINAFDFSLSRSDYGPLTNAVGGHATSREKSSRGARSKAYTYDAFLQNVALERVSLDDLRGHKVLLVNLSRSYGGILEWLQDGSLEESEEDNAIMEAARGNWRISAEHLNGEKPIEYVIALYFKKSIGVYKVKAETGERVFEYEQSDIDDLPHVPNQSNLSNEAYIKYQERIRKIRRKIRKRRSEAQQTGESWKTIKAKLDFKLSANERGLLDEPSALDRRYFECATIQNAGDDPEFKDMIRLFKDRYFEDVKFNQNGTLIVG